MSILFQFDETGPVFTESGALGVDANNKLNDNDRGKPVKLGPANNFILCATGEQIDGFVETVEPHTVNNGFSFGSVMRSSTKRVKVSSDQAGNLAVGALVVAGIQTARNTVGDPTVKAGSPGSAFWRVKRIISGTGAAGDTVLVERI